MNFNIIRSKSEIEKCSTSSKPHSTRRPIPGPVQLPPNFNITAVDTIIDQIISAIFHQKLLSVHIDRDGVRIEGVDNDGNLTASEPGHVKIPKSLLKSALLLSTHRLRETGLASGLYRELLIINTFLSDWTVAWNVRRRDGFDQATAMKERLVTRTVAINSPKSSELWKYCQFLENRGVPVKFGHSDISSISTAHFSNYYIHDSKLVARSVESFERHLQIVETDVKNTSTVLYFVKTWANDSFAEVDAAINKLLIYYYQGFASLWCAKKYLAHLKSDNFDNTLIQMSRSILSSRPDGPQLKYLSGFIVYVQGLNSNKL